MDEAKRAAIIFAHLAPKYPSLDAALLIAENVADIDVNVCRRIVELTDGPEISATAVRRALAEKKNP